MSGAQCNAERTYEKKKVTQVADLNLLVSELTLLLGKLHESFVGLAAQLHVVHEMVKVSTVSM